jgi:serine/threonine-protein kinase
MATRTSVRRIAGRYELGERLGGGGMGEVFAARDRATDRQVAVKLLPRGGRGDAGRASADRFAREVRLAASVHHPHVVEVLDGGLEEQPFLVMERLSGRTLRDGLGEGPMDADGVRELGRQVLAGLVALHEAGIAHRDLKPDNVFEAARGAWKIGDLGIAAELAADATLTLPGHVLGSIRYVAPERLRGEPGTEASDIYGVGVLLYEALAGRPAFAADAPDVVADRVREGHVEPVAEAAPDADAALTLAIARAMDPDPARRFADAASFAEALSAMGATSNIGDATVVLPPLDPTAELPVDPPPVEATGTAGSTLAEVRPARVARRANGRPAAARDRSRQMRLLAAAGAVMLVLMLGLAIAARPDDRPAARDRAPATAPTTAPAPTSSPEPASEEDPGPTANGNGNASQGNGHGGEHGNAGGNGKGQANGH